MTILVQMSILVINVNYIDKRNRRIYDEEKGNMMVAIINRYLLNPLSLATKGNG